MNLNYDQSQESLKALLAKASKEIPSHYVAVDYDGEVIVDPDLRFPEIDVKRYKFCTQIRNASLSNLRKIQALHHALLDTLSERFHSMGNNDFRIAA